MAKLKGVYKRGTVWWIRYAGLDGRIRFESSGSSSFRIAQARLVERRKTVLDGKEPIPQKRIANIPFRDLAQRYLSWCVSQRSYPTKQIFVRHLVNEFGGVPIRGFTTHMVEQWQANLLAIGKSRATCNRLLTCLKHALRKAVDWELVDEEAVRRAWRVKLLQENNRRLRYLTSEECEALITACQPHLKPIVTTALHTGMRKGEILSLRWDQVDLKHGFILLEHTKNGERREVPINNTVRQTLSKTLRRLDSPFVFVDGKGSRFLDVKRSFHSACRKAGIKDFRFHDLRHTFASHLVMARVDITTVKELLGHKSLTMTMRYAHLAPEHTAKAVAALEEAIRPNVMHPISQAVGN